MVSRRWVLGGLLASGAGIANAAPFDRALIPPPRPNGFAKRAAPDAGDLINAANLSGDTAFVVADARSGAVLEAVNGAQKMPPASTAKAITTAYALNYLGPEYVFRTQLVATGPVVNGRVQGDLILVGGGDPILDTDQLGQMAAQLRARGVRGVDGAFRYFAGALPQIHDIDPDQPDHVGYNPSISGLNLNFNRVHFEWKRASQGYTVTMDARARNYAPRVNTARMRVVNRKAPVYTYTQASGGVDDWTVASAALGNGGARWLPVRHPGGYAAEVFQAVAGAQGIALPSPRETRNRPAGTVVAENISPGLTTILRAMMKYSTNLTAEVVGLTATGRRSGSIGGLSASGGQMTDWLGDRLGQSNARFVDHSGLGEDSRISPQDMTRVLSGYGANSVLAGLMKDVYLKTADGKPDKSNPVKIRAKTGTLNFVSGLTGYVKTRSGRDLVFATFMADQRARAAITDESRERPQGGRTWTRKARNLQLDLINRWATVYNS